VCPNQSYHRQLHARQRVVDLGGNPKEDKWCSYHKSLHKIEEFSTNPSEGDGYNGSCRAATNEYRKKKGFNRGKFDWRARLQQQYRRILKAYTKRNVCWLNPRRDSL